MGIGAFFILLVIVILIGIALFFAAGPGLGLWIRKTSPKGDSIEGREGERRPDTRRVETEQQARFTPPDD